MQSSSTVIFAQNHGHGSQQFATLDSKSNNGVLCHVVVAATRVSDPSLEKLSTERLYAKSF
jgi:hypothetical protein